MNISDKLILIREGYSITEINSGQLVRHITESQDVQDSNFLFLEFTSSEMNMMDLYLHEADSNFASRIANFFKWIRDKIVNFIKWIRSKFSKDVKDTKVKLQQVADDHKNKPDLKSKIENHGKEASEYLGNEMKTIQNQIEDNMDKIKEEIKNKNKKEEEEYERKLQELKAEQKRLDNLKKEKEQRAKEAQRKHDEEQLQKHMEKQSRTILIPPKFENMETMEVYVNRIKNLQEKLTSNINGGRYIFDGISEFSKLDKEDEDSHDDIIHIVEEIVSGKRRLSDIGTELTGIAVSTDAWEKEPGTDNWKQMHGSKDLTTSQIIEGLKHLTDVIDKNTNLIENISNKVLDDIKVCERKAIEDSGQKASENKNYMMLARAVKAINECITFLTRLNSVFLRSVNETLDTISKLK